MFVMISGFSGGGKSTLLGELAERGYSVVAEPGRRILAEERAGGEGGALPWVNAAAFARRALAVSIADHARAKGLTFFDRGVVDAAVAMAAAGGARPDAVLASVRYDRLFLAPPWPEIFVNDEDRRHSLEQALRDFSRVEKAYKEADYDPIMLPRDTVAGRADFILERLRV